MHTGTYISIHILTCVPCTAHDLHIRVQLILYLYILYKHVGLMKCSGGEAVSHVYIRDMYSGTWIDANLDHHTPAVSAVKCHWKRCKETIDEVVGHNIIPTSSSCLSKGITVSFLFCCSQFLAQLFNFNNSSSIVIENANLESIPHNTGSLNSTGNSIVWLFTNWATSE